MGECGREIEASGGVNYSKSKYMQSIDILGDTGLLSKAIPGFKPRLAQQEMAKAIEDAIDVQAELMIEAGTGTGKTFGYLVPAFISQKKTIISTGTKNLQDQLFLKDIPVIKKLFSHPFKVVLLKGRANYLCHYRLERSVTDGRLTSKHEVTQLQRIHHWSKQTDSGDIAEINSVPEDAGIWSSVTSTVDNCLNQDCPFLKDCFIIKARKEAMAADVLVVNHYLFFADMVLQEEGFGELLPGAEVVIFDEAHHLPEIATHFFSRIFSSRQLMILAKDSQEEGLQSAQDMQTIQDKAAQLQLAVQKMRESFGKELKRAPWPLTLEVSLIESIEVVNVALQELEEILKAASCRSKGLENCWRRTAQLLAQFKEHTGRSPNHTVHWYETHLQNFTIQLTALNIAEEFKKYMQAHPRTWIFTSATLSVNNQFQLFRDALGLTQALQLQFASPFDYQKQAILYAPRGLPEPNSRHYTSAMMEVVVPVLEATKGRAFILFTSFKALEEAHALLKHRIHFPLLLQGSLPKRKLIEQFKSEGNAVLLATNSFWYGVDIRGEALSCVIIDKLPFAHVKDPVLQARIQSIRNQGQDPFQQYQLPNAVLMLKQGAGRLIRDYHDRGVLMICDPRLVGARYGHVFLQSLPNMQRTREIAKVTEFLHNQQQPC